MLRQDKSRLETWFDLAELIPECQSIRTVARRGVDHVDWSKPRHLHQFHFTQQTESMGHTVGSRVASRDDLDTQFVSADETCRMLIENFFEIGDHRFIPAHQIRAVHLFLNRRERWHPCNLAIPHLSELI